MQEAATTPREFEHQPPAAFQESMSCLIVDDDEVFRNRLGRAMQKRGFETYLADGMTEAFAAIEEHDLIYAVVDLNLGDGDGLKVVNQLKKKSEDARSVILTGYGNISSAVHAVRLGAVDYLTKPVDADEVAHSLLTKNGDLPPPPENPMTPDRVRWEHIYRVYNLCDRNTSETARRLQMHRRTLQRILSKRAPL